MLDRLRAATTLVALTLVLSACASSAAQANAPQPTRASTIVASATAAPTAAPTAVPTSTPAPTAVPTLAQNVIVAGVNVGGLTPDAARAKLEQELAPLLRPLDVQSGDKHVTLKPEAIDLQLPLDDLLAEAEAAKAGDQIELSISYDAAKLRTALGDLAEASDPPAAISVISSTQAISRSFALSGGGLDLDAAVQQVDARLHAIGAARQITLMPSAAAPRPTPQQLQEQIEAIAKQWKDVAGVYVYDIASGQEIASLNKNTVFSAASTIKVAILLNAYVHLDKFTDQQEQALQKMIVDSDNLAANSILAAAVGGTGTEDALHGAEQMSAMLRDLGLPHIYLYVPFEAVDYLAQQKVTYQLGPKRDGEAPYTDSGRALRASPAEMAQLYIMIDQCRQGTGVLLEKYGKHLNAQRCQEMLDRLNENGDNSRMRSGLPDSVRVEHKSGWVDDMQADVGIVRSPGGDFVIATYLFRATKIAIPDDVFQPFLGGFARLVYSYYNPILASKP